MLVLLVLAVGLPGSVQAAVRYVKKSATGANNGTSWTNAYISLNLALPAAQAGDEIWVAAETHRPTIPTDSSDQRSVTFMIPAGVSLYGGFAGTETSRSQRNISANLTILSGDRANNDSWAPGSGSNPPTYTGYGENAYHVVSFSSTSNRVRLDGFTIQAGSADGASNGVGGGVFGSAGPPPNSAAIVNCTFLRNRALVEGGGAWVYGNVAVVNCRFSGNATFYGIGDVGGAMYVAGSTSFGTPTIANCILTANYVTDRGGGLYISGPAAIANCTFWANHADVTAGAIYREDTNIPIINSLSWQDTSPDSSHPIMNGTDYLSADDPHFVDADGADNIAGTADDDVHLRRDSPLLEVGVNSGIPPDVADLDGDGNIAEPTPFDADGGEGKNGASLRIVGACTNGGPTPRVDLGAYEYQFTAPAGTQAVIFVKTNASGANDGTSWTNAFTRLQDALCSAQRSGGVVKQIWVAAGTYKPDRGPGLTPGDRTASFEMVFGVAVRGGFAGNEDSATFKLADRDFVTNRTILSGDLNGDDGYAPGVAGGPPTYTNYGDNSYQVIRAVNSGVTIDGFTITGGNGAGVNNSGGLSASGTTVVNCTFLANRGYIGGGANIQGSGAVANCQFSGNYATSSGGGLYIQTATLVNCVFTANYAERLGGGVYLYGQASASNCTFWANASGLNAGAVANWEGSPVNNSILWQNTSPDTQNPEYYGTVTGTIGVNPRFVDPDGPDNIPGTADDDVRLLPGSPAIDAGVNANVAPDTADLDGDGNPHGPFDPIEPTPLDRDGHPRFVHDPVTSIGSAPRVDNGAYERYTGRFPLVASSISVPEGSMASLPVALSWDPGGPVVVTVTKVSGDDDITIQSGASLAFNSANYSTTQTVVLAAAEDADAVLGTATIRLSVPGFPSADVIAVEGDNDLGSILYVNAAAPATCGGGPCDGQSWATAFRDLQSAITAATPPENVITDIWVAQGTYVPSVQSDPADPRSKTFQLRSGLALTGGFAGTEASPAQRDIAAHPTILTGDLGTGASGHSYHVVTATGTDLTAILDGFTITGGVSEGPIAALGETISPTSCGGGLYAVGSGSPTILNCTFTANSASDCGGGIYLGRLQKGSGVGSGVSALIVNCRFTQNVAGDLGGGAFLDGYPVLVNGIFTGNQAHYGGGLASLNAGSGATTGTNCVFYGNTAVGAGSYGGGLASPYGGLGLTNCIVWANTAPGAAPEYRQWRSGYDPGTGTTCWIQNDLHPIADPRFVNPPTDLRLQAGSPCIDAGTNSPYVTGFSSYVGSGPYFYRYLPSIDFAFNHRRADDPATPDSATTGGPQVDIGAYEFGAGPVPSRLYVRAALQSDPSATSMGTSWSDAFVNLQPALQTAFAARGRVSEIWVAAGQYVPGQYTPDSFRLPSGVAVYGGFAGTETSLSQRDWLVNTTILTHQQSYYANLIDGTGANPTAVLDGFNLWYSHSDGIHLAGGRPTIRNCILSLTDCPGAGNNALRSDYGRLSLSNFTLDSSSPAICVGAQSTALMRSSDTWLEGVFTAKWLTLYSSRLEGPGRLEIVPAIINLTGGGTYLADSILISGDAPGAAPSVIACDVRGAGGIEIDAGQTLRIEGGAVVDLSGQTGTGCADPAQSANWGEIVVNGTLDVLDATLQNTRVQVLLANLQGSTQILNNDIRLLETASNFGGQFFVSPQSVVHCNTIYSEGDRYLDFDPDPAITPRPDIFNNKITVRIKQGIQSAQGELLELRTPDADNAIGGGHSGAYPVAASPGYSDTWVLEKLTVDPGAKVNLTNRQGFVFQNPAITVPEAIYVKQLALGAGAVLNAGLQRLYYQSLTDDSGTPITRLANDSTTTSNGARIIDVPLLGFSLGIIGMNDATAPPFNEFDVRIYQRLRDPADQQPGIPPFKEGKIVRLTDSQVHQELPTLDAGGGLMEMRTHATNMQSASSVAAKGAFARAGDESITVTFDYLFREADANTLINVYVSDGAALGPAGGANPQSIPGYLATLRPPASGVGSVGSNQPATFYGVFPRGSSLNFVRGTFVELELRGQNARVWIDDFDPQVHCEAAKCGSFDTANSVVDWRDYLALAAETGKSVLNTTNKYCLDLTDDGFIDFSDLLAWDAARSNCQTGACCVDVTDCYDVNRATCETFGGGYHENATCFANPCTAGRTPLDPPLPRGEVERGFDSLVRGEVASAERTLQPMPLGGSSLLPAGASLLTLGKSTNAQVLQDLVYSFSNGAGSSAAVPCPSSTDCVAATRLVSDGTGTAYVVQGLYGILRLSDGARIVRPQLNVAFVGTNGVDVGKVIVNNLAVGLPLADAVFGSDGQGAFVYVVPVVVHASTPSPAHDYKAIARLRPTSNGNFTIEKLLGDDPLVGGNISNCTTCKQTIDLQGLREIDRSPAGLLYALSGDAYNDNNWVQVFDASGNRVAAIHDYGVSGNSTRYLLPAAPVALHVSQSSDPLVVNKLYLASGIDAGGATTQIYRFSIVGGTSLTLDGSMQIQHPASAYCDTHSCSAIHAEVRAIEEDSAGNVYVVGATEPVFSESSTLADQGVTTLFTSATIARIDKTAAWSLSPATIGALLLKDGTDLSQPVSALIASGSNPPSRQITAWRSVRTHSGIGPLGITLNASANGNGGAGPTVEPRQGGIQRVEVDFDGPVTLGASSTGAIAVVGRTTTAGAMGSPVNYTASSVIAADADTLAILFNPGALPDATCYTITLGVGAINETVSGDADCQVRSLVGDTNTGGSSAGIVKLGDVLLTKARVGQAVAGNAALDVDVNGGVGVSDVMLVKSRAGKRVLCP